MKKVIQQVGVVEAFRAVGHQVVGKADMTMAKILGTLCDRCNVMFKDIKEYEYHMIDHNTKDERLKSLEKRLDVCEAANRQLQDERRERTRELENFKRRAFLAEGKVDMLSKQINMMTMRNRMR